MNIEAFSRILPEVSDLNREYFAGLDAHELRLQVCDEDGSYRFPASPVCPLCLSSRFTWTAVSGKATLWSWIVMHQNYFEAFADELPYVVAFVQLDEGPFIMSTVTDDVDALTIGATLQLSVESVGDQPVPKFALAE
jgi:uncharacterized OB-fold protein